MDPATILSLLQTMLAALQLLVSFNLPKWKSEVTSLIDTVEFIKTVIESAEDKELSREDKLYIEKLSNVIYDADDLIDEFATETQIKLNNLSDKDEFNKKLSHIVSSVKRVFAPYSKKSRDMIVIKKKLDTIAGIYDRFCLKHSSQLIRKVKLETSSNVFVPDIIGRDAEKEEIVNMLLDSNVRHDHVSFVTIVGMGGLGKTTLAQLVYNDEAIKNEFPTRIWVCVGDENTQELNLKAILAKILQSITGINNHDNHSLDKLEREVLLLLKENKYLLILDDVWNEKRDDWAKLESFLKQTHTGSWVVMTTRSSITARNVTNGSSVDLKGLSDDDSWRLFESVAFVQEDGKENPSDLIEIGQMVVKQCAKVPLAIRVVGSLLRGQSKEPWLLFQNFGLNAITSEKDNIFPILMFSYHHLESPLKCCFRYCALFPKDHKIKKEKLIRLWRAQGYIVPFNTQSVEDVAEEYFSILLHRCFFQDVEIYRDEIISCKIHDLMHDVAQQVARNEVRAVDCVTSKLDERIRHLYVKSMSIEGSLTNKSVRTLILDDEIEEFEMGTELEKLKRLRALDLRFIMNVPETIGKLLHLRYLDLSRNYNLVKLPQSITKLVNLETLLLRDCDNLKELPADVDKLVRLRCLDIGGCYSLDNMPARMGKLSCVEELTMFVVNLRNSSSCNVGLKCLRGLTQLRGYIKINIKGCSKGRLYVKGGYLINKEHLTWIEFTFERYIVGDGDEEEALMEKMQPHPNLTHLELCYYKGGRMPSWGREDKLVSSLPNLVTITLWRCDGMKIMSGSGIGELPHLRVLSLLFLKSLEYIEEKSSGVDRAVTAASGSSSRGSLQQYNLFFPSLKVLELKYLEAMKGWWRSQDDDDSNLPDAPLPLPCFPPLFKLDITECPNLTSLPSFSTIEEVFLTGTNKRVYCVCENDVEGVEPICSSCKKVIYKRSSVERHIHLNSLNKT